MTIEPLTGPSGLTCAWLTDALKDAGHAGAALPDVTIEEIRTGEMMLVMLERSCEAIRRLDTFGAIDQAAA
jgi:hypothetical protein